MDIGIGLILGVILCLVMRQLRRMGKRRLKFGQIQQHCAAEGQAQVDDTARVLRVLQNEPDFLWNLGQKWTQKG